MQYATKKIVGLTGGIGSGKTTIAKLFVKLGVPVYFADDEAKKLMQNDAITREKLMVSFGENVFKDSVLNRQFLANLIFNNKTALQKINAIVHPEVKKHFQAWVAMQDFSYVMQENAILFENNSQDQFDKIITVTAPNEVKIKRVMERDNTTKEKVLSRMRNQLQDDFKIANSDFVIHNIDLEQSKILVKLIHQQLLVEQF